MRRTTALWLLGAVLVAVGARLAHGGGALGYDALWGLRWGDELLHGGRPSLDADFAPTPHPLANLVSAVLLLAGVDAATTGLLALSWLSLGALAMFVARLGTVLFSLPVGLLAGLLVVTRPLLVVESAQALVDLPFLALVVAATDREARRPREGWTVPVLLVLAGLLRPEGWALAAAYLIHRRADARQLAPLLAVAPVLWALMDLWATGDALHSLNGTRALGEVLDRPTSTGTAITSAPAALRDTMLEPLLFVALGGAAVGLLARTRSSALPGAIIALGLAGFVVLGIAGLPLLGRYLLLPVCMLAIFAGLAVFGWVDAPDRRLLWRLGAGAAAAAMIAGMPSDRDALDEARAFGAQRLAIQDELREAVRDTSSSGCKTVTAPDRRSLAVVTAQREASGGRGRLAFAYAGPEVAGSYALLAFGRQTLPAGARRVFTGRYWVASAIGCYGAMRR
ncbi:MAG: hypothetical protein WKF94_04260 [Solirubrobacteraceae bacterium]